MVCARARACVCIYASIHIVSDEILLKIVGPGQIFVIINGARGIEER